LALHPVPFTAVELKEKCYAPVKRPQVDHIVQVHQQMHTMGADFIFLSYEHLDSITVFLVEFSPPFWHWCLRRWELFHTCVRDQRVPTDGFVEQALTGADGRQPIARVDMLWLGSVVGEYWDTAMRPDWLEQRFSGGGGAVEMPPEPPWRLVAHRRALDKGTCEPRESSRGRTVCPATIVAALGTIFETRDAGEAIRRVRRHADGCCLFGT
jgi:hypothetical protein